MLLWPVGSCVLLDETSTGHQETYAVGHFRWDRDLRPKRVAE